MQFFISESFVIDEKWTEENEDRRAIREKIRNISIKSKLFNDKLQDHQFYFIVNITESIAKIGIICKDSLFSKCQLDSFLNTISLKLKDNQIEEITFDVLCSLLQTSDREGYIEDYEKVLKQFKLYDLIGRYSRNIDFGENLLEDISKKAAYEKVEDLLGKKTILPELDRIFTNSGKYKSIGHPVHYIVQSDDHDTRNGMYQLILRSLFANGRLQNRRYVFLNIEPSDGISEDYFDSLYHSCIGGSIVVRYYSSSDAEDDYANASRDTIKILCKTMKKYCNQVLTIFCLPRESTELKEIFFEYLGSTSFIEIKEDFISGEPARDYLKRMAKEKKVRIDKKLQNMIEDEQGYLAPDLHRMFDEWYNNKLKTSIFPQYKEIVSAKKEMAKAAPKGSAYDELMEMIGLTEAKKVINQALNYFKVQKLYADKGVKMDRPSMHMVFTGNPGSAKTTVARLYTRILRENDLLSKGKIIEVGRGDLIGKYVGWTAPTIKEKFKEAEGGVLFIDEAYSLVDDRNGSFGDEAINTIVQEMENHREDVIVIFAGYPDKMEEFLQRNPGLRSRIAFHVPFEDYSTSELLEIAHLVAKKKGLNLSAGACNKLEKLFEKARLESDFGNGRYVRNTIEKAKMSQATRLLSLDYEKVRKEDLEMICEEDIEMPAIQNNGHYVRKIGFAV